MNTKLQNIDADILLAALASTLCGHIAITNSDFDILFVNQAWVEFGTANGIAADFNWIGKNYLAPCVGVDKQASQFCDALIAGLKRLNTFECSHFEFEYPCHSESEDRWFYLRVSRFVQGHKRYFVFVHTNITEQVSTEQYASRLWWTKRQ